MLKASARQKLLAFSLVLAAGSGLLLLGYRYFGPHADEIEKGDRPTAVSQLESKRSPAELRRAAFLNVRPEVKYVGDEACGKCHAAIAETYRRHPMGNSIAPIKESLPIERYDLASNNPFQFSGITYRVDRLNGGTQHGESLLDPHGKPLAEMHVPISFAVGSGQNGRAYLVDLRWWLSHLAGQFACGWRNNQDLCPV